MGFPPPSYDQSGAKSKHVNTRSVLPCAHIFLCGLTEKDVTPNWPNAYSTVKPKSFIHFTAVLQRCHQTFFYHVFVFAMLRQSTACRINKPIHATLLASFNLHHVAFTLCWARPICENGSPGSPCKQACKHATAKAGTSVAGFITTRDSNEAFR